VCPTICYTIATTKTTQSRFVAVKEQGSGFAMMLTALAVVLTIGAIWFALSR
jgi:hypothetical protein